MPAQDCCDVVGEHNRFFMPAGTDQQVQRNKRSDEERKQVHFSCLPKTETLHVSAHVRIFSANFTLTDVLADAWFAWFETQNSPSPCSFSQA